MYWAWPPVMVRRAQESFPDQFHTFSTLSANRDQVLFDIWEYWSHEACSLCILRNHSSRNVALLMWFFKVKVALFPNALQCLGNRITWKITYCHLDDLSKYRSFESLLVVVSVIVPVMMIAWSIFLVLSRTMAKQKGKIIYEVKEFNPLLDSSNMTREDWIKIAQSIEVRRVL